MSLKPNLLVVGDYNRKDYIDLFKACRSDFNFFFLEYASSREIQQTYYRSYGRAIFWGDYKDAQDLLAKVRPHKVLFYFIESYYHVMLNLTCKVAGVPTYYIDHGLRDVNINTRLEKYFIKKKGKPTYLKYAQKLRELLPRLKARIFLQNSARALPQGESDFFKEFYKIRKTNHYIDTFKLINSPLRVADVYITFSHKVYKAHQQHDFLPAEKKVHFIGFPSYDHLAAIKPVPSIGKQIIFLDQGLAARGLLGWTASEYSIFIREITGLCARNGYSLFVKLHPVQPKQEERVWETHQNAKLIDSEDLMKLLPSTSLFIGFFSTYLLPLASLEHTTLLTLENHPVGRIDVSKSFIEAGVAHPLYSMQDLEWALQHIEQLHQKQLPNKAKFTEEWMYKFDGKAGERLRDILLSDEL